MTGTTARARPRHIPLGGMLARIVHSVKTGAIILSVLAVLVWGVAVRAETSARGAPVEDRPTTSLAGGRLRLGATLRLLAYGGLREPETFNPAAGILPDKGEWTRSWEETRAFVSLAYDLLSTDHVLLTPGFSLGLAEGRFFARNPAIGFSESWMTREAFLWGPTVGLELRWRPGSGPFVRAGYALFLAQAVEASERVRSLSGQGTPPDQREARFSWRSDEFLAGAGYRLGAFEPFLGLSYVAFRLDKRLDHAIPDTGLPGAAGETIRALNAAESAYGYENVRPLAPLAALAWRPWPGLALEAAARLSEDRDMRLTLRLSF